MGPGKRVLAALAAVLLVLASAGVGAAVANAVHKNSSNQQSIGSTSPFGGGSGNGNGGFGGFGNGSNGSGSNGSSSNGTGSNGSSSSGSGTLDASAIAAKVSPALVNINTTLSDGRAAGTGIIIGSSGEVLTNNHVIADATSIKVDIGGTGNTHDAQVVGYDVADDVALVQIQGVSNLKTVDLGDPSKLNVGDPVVAIGNALGEGGAPKVSQGKVTGLDQQVTAGDPTGGTTETLQHMIQIDAPIQPGDSGGALVNSQGQVVGMNTAAAGTGGRFTQQTGSNVGFAIPVSSAIQVIRQIQSGNGSGNVHIGSSRALLGVNVADPSQGGDSNCSSSSSASGALVVGVQGSSAASAAGLQECDTITSLNGKSIADQNALHLALTAYNPGDHVTIGWTDPSGQTHSASVTLGSGPPA
jgi:S1-C subfamily serine protease